MTHREAKSQFVEFVIPNLPEGSTPDYPMRREAWNNWVDSLHRSGSITDFQAENWVQPHFCNPK